MIKHVHIVGLTTLCIQSYVCIVSGKGILPYEKRIVLELISLDKYKSLLVLIHKNVTYYLSD